MSWRMQRREQLRSRTIRHLGRLENTALAILGLSAGYSSRNRSVVLKTACLVPYSAAPTCRGLFARSHPNIVPSIIYKVISREKQYLRDLDTVETVGSLHVYSRRLFTLV